MYQIGLAIVVASAALVFPAAGGEDRPITLSDVYVKQSTWQATVLASREALMRAERRTKRSDRSLPEFGKSDYTIAAWIRTKTGGTVFSRSSDTGVWAERGGKVLFVRGGRLGFDACFIGVALGRTHIADGKWHHVAATYSGAGNSQLTLYVDGKPDGGRGLKADPDAAGHVVRIGMSAQKFWPPNGFVGEIDEVRIYDRVLAPAEIPRCMNASARVGEGGCVAIWSFDHGAAGVSGNGRRGVIQGAKPAEGKVGKALRFDGKSCVCMPGPAGAGLRQRLWQSIERDFADADARRQMAREREDHIWDADWRPGDRTVLAQRYAAACRRVPALAERATKLASGAKDDAGLAAVREVYHLSRCIADTTARLARVDTKALRLAVADLTKTFGDRYPNGKTYLARLGTADMTVAKLRERLAAGDEAALKQAEALIALQAEALQANPLLDFDHLLLIKRSERNLGLTNNWNSNSSIAKAGYDNEIAMLSPVRPGGGLATVFRPDGNGSKFVGDVDLHFDAGRLLLSMPGKNGRWQVHELEIGAAGRPGKLRELPLIIERDVDNYDACYLPDGNVIFCSTAPFVGVPCVTGSSHVCHLYLWQRDSGKIRRLTFEQDHDWCPTVLNNGRVLYLRWEYSDIPHFASRILFHMNPDGTGQMAYYGSNSYWPNSAFYARPVPNDATKFVAIVGGHHDVPRMGELVLFDMAKGRFETDGVVQRIPGRGKPVEPILRDGLVRDSWPKFLHPYPLSDKYLIVSAKPTPKAAWGVYLVDVFDNMLLLAEAPGYALLEPIPFRKTPRPPVIPSKVQPNRKDALVYLTDVYAGDGLKGVPRGTIKQLRLITYHFAYHGMGGQINRVGLDGPWDIKRVLGTVPVDSDGSAMFRVPANTPISIQPLDGEGKAVQLMRSWLTGMPGEVLSCVGCHEHQNTVVPAKQTSASSRPPSDIAPWYGPMRGFSFKREVQPVLDKYCVGCHNGQKRADGTLPVDLRTRPDVHPPAPSKAYSHGTKFPPSYLALRSHVRSPTIESDMHMLAPYEFHADTTELVQMLAKGHHGVRLNAEAWDRLITWIDLHTPAHGTWHEIVGEKAMHQRDRRREMKRLYAGIDEDPEAIYEAKRGPITPVVPKPVAKPGAKTIDCPGWPFDAVEAQRRQRAVGTWQRSVDLGDGVKLELVRIPAGEFVMGDAECAARRVKIDRPFWMGAFEVTNEQFARFDPSHDSRLEHGDFLQFSHEERGYLLNRPKQPVVRISWQQAMAFCRWLSAKTGERFALPTEAQWEYACRAGSATPMWYGEIDTDFARYANLADARFRKVDTYDPWKLPYGAIHPYRPAIATVNDKHRVSAPVGSYAANPWGLHDMHGNVAEWVGQETGVVSGAKKIVRGGAWSDRPKRAQAAFRLAYYPWQCVYNVGFRVVGMPGSNRVASRAD